MSVRDFDASMQTSGLVCCHYHEQSIKRVQTFVIQANGIISSRLARSAFRLAVYNMSVYNSQRDRLTTDCDIGSVCDLVGTHTPFTVGTLLSCVTGEFATICNAMCCQVYWKPLKREARVRSIPLLTLGELAPTGPRLNQKVQN